MFALAKTGPKNLWAEKIAPTKLKISVSSKYCDIITHGSLAAGGDSCFYVGTLCQAFFFEALHFILRAPLNAVTGNIPAVDLLPILILEPTDYCLCERPVFSPER